MYSLKKGIWKGIRNLLVNMLPLVVVILGLYGITDLTIAEALEKAYPAIGTVTVGSLIQFIINWAKNK